MEQKWIPIEEQIPKEDEYILLSFENFSIPVIGRFEDGAFYAGDEDVPLVIQDMYVNAWMPLPEPYQVGAENAHTKKLQTNADRIRSMTDEELLDFLCSIETYDEGSAKTIEGGIAMCSVAEVKEWLLRKSEV